MRKQKKYKNAEKPHTEKQKRFFDFLLTGVTQTKAAELAGYSPKSSGTMSSWNLDAFADYWADMLRLAGANDAKIAQTIADGLDATKVVGYLEKKNKEKDGKPKEAKPDKSVSDDFVDTPDFPSRAKFADMALKLRNAYPRESVVLEHKGEIGVKSESYYSVKNLLKDMSEDDRNTILGIVGKALSGRA